MHRWICCILKDQTNTNLLSKTHGIRSECQAVERDTSSIFNVKFVGGMRREIWDTSVAQQDWSRLSMEQAV